MNPNMLEHLKTLQTKAIDARNGYQEALKDAEGKGMSPLVKTMIDTHNAHAAELAAQIPPAETTDPSGSFMTTVHKTIMDIRSLFGGLDASVLPGLIDGEKRNVSAYDEALAVERMPLLVAQRDKLLAKIAEMEAHKTT